MNADSFTKKDFNFIVRRIQWWTCRCITKHPFRDSETVKAELYSPNLRSGPFAVIGATGIVFDDLDTTIISIHFESVGKKLRYDGIRCYSLKV